MRHTVSLTENRDFKRLYAAGKSAVNPYLALYCRKNRTGQSRLGITVGTKTGNAVVRNRIRRRIREAYRLNEERVARGYDIVVVARVRAAHANYHTLENALLSLFEKLRIYRP